MASALAPSSLILLPRSASPPRCSVELTAAAGGGDGVAEADGGGRGSIQGCEEVRWVPAAVAGDQRCTGGNAPERWWKRSSMESLKPEARQRRRDRGVGFLPDPKEKKIPKARGDSSVLAAPPSTVGLPSSLLLLPSPASPLCCYSFHRRPPLLLYLTTAALPLFFQSDEGRGGRGSKGWEGDGCAVRGGGGAAPAVARARRKGGAAARWRQGRREWRLWWVGGHRGELLCGNNEAEQEIRAESAAPPRKPVRLKIEAPGRSRPYVVREKISGQVSAKRELY